MSKLAEIVHQENPPTICPEETMSPSIKDVAAFAGVSVGTVSNVLNHPGRVSPDTVDKVRGAIKSLGFVRNDVARHLRAGDSRTIAMLVMDAANPFFTDLAKGAEDQAATLGLSVVMGNTAESSERENNYLDLFEEQRVRGVLISPSGDVEERLLQLKKFGIPSVLVDRASTSGKLSSVSVDDEAGGRIAVNHLIESGRSRIGFVGGALDVPQVRDRLSGAREALDSHPGVSLDVYETSATTVLEGRRVGEQIVALDTSARPDAIFAANDLVAIGLLQAFMAIPQIRVPDDIALIGYDDIDFSPSAIVPLTSIRQPSRLMGQTALDILNSEALDASAKPQEVVFQPELIVRTSTSTG
jgi:LacI family transcriptional regulator